jgi:hypothetical protein
MSEMRILLMAARKGPNVLFCLPEMTNCILLVSVLVVQVLLATLVPV